MAYDVVSIMKAIRDNSSADYQARIPETTQNNLSEVGSKIINYQAATNEFLSALMNRIVLTIVNNKTFKNPMEILKKGQIPLGDGIEEIYTNPVTGELYDGSSTDLLKIKKPDTQTLFYRMNRQSKYPVSITKNSLMRAFTGVNEFTNFLNSIVSALYSGDSLDEFTLMKQLLNSMYTNGHINTLNVYDENTESISDEKISKALVKNIKTYSKLFKYPSTNFNKYSTVKSSANPIRTWTPAEDQILILDAVVSANIDVDVLAYAFNLDKAQIQTQTLDIDNFNGAPILGVLCDKSLFQVYDDLKQLDSFYNADNMSTKYILHHWQTMQYSLFANAIAFTYTPKTESGKEITG